MMLNWFLAQLVVGLTSSVGPTWVVGGVIPSEGHCMVGRIHSCSEVRHDGWWGPKTGWIGGHSHVIFSMTLRDLQSQLAC